MFFRWLLTAACLIYTVQCDTENSFRLNSKIWPSEYTIRVSLNFENSTFQGHVSIKMATKEYNVTQVKLHSALLEYGGDDILLAESDSDGKAVIEVTSENPVTFDVDNTFAFINLVSPMEVNTDYTLDISYTGIIMNNIASIFSKNYTDDGVIRKYGSLITTKTSARAAFPCFDEPMYKAKFNWIIDRPPVFKVTIANTEVINSEILPNGNIRETFSPTPIMSTFINAFVISDYKIGKKQEGGNDLKVYTRPAAQNQAGIAFDYTKKLIDVLSEYFGIDYYSMIEFYKLVPIQDFNIDGMENWGIIYIQEYLLMLDAKLTAPRYRTDMASILTHETTHSWLGNLVTCHWWGDLWLKEGFATYFQNYIPKLVDPELHMENQQVVLTAASAYNSDNFNGAVPMSNPNVNSFDAITTQFGYVSYEKSATVIKMMSNLIGEEDFRNAMRIFLQRNKFGFVYPEDLYAAFEEAVALTGSMDAYPETNITAVFSAWANQPGYPIIDVSVDKNNVTITQRRFYNNQSITSDEIYPIPITYATSSNLDFSSTKPEFIFNERTMSFSPKNRIADGGWIIFNVQESGFYITNYDKNTWQSIAKALRGPDRTKIDVFNRLKILYEMNWLYRSDLVDFELMHNVVSFLRFETVFPIWYAVYDVFLPFTFNYGNTPLYPLLQKYLIGLMDTAIETLGFVPRESDTYMDVRTRIEVGNLACKIEEPRCMANAAEVMETLRIKQDLSAISSSDTYRGICFGLRQGTSADFDLVWRLFQSCDVVNTQTRLLLALGCTKNRADLKKYLLLTASTDSPIPAGILHIQVWYGVLLFSENVDVGFEVLQQNYTGLVETGVINTALFYVVDKLRTEERFNKFSSWVSNCSECSEDFKSSALSQVASARQAVAKAAANYPGIERVLQNDPNVNPGVCRNDLNVKSKEKKR